MDSKRLITAFLLSALILMGWNTLFPPPAPAQQQAAQQTVQAASASPAELTATVPVTVNTGTVRAVIDEKSGDLRGLTLVKYNAANDENKEFVLFSADKAHTYIAQSKLTGADGRDLLEGVSFTAAQKNYTVSGGNTEVRLSAPEKNGLKIDKVYTFSPDGYLFGVRFDVKNNGSQTAKIGGSYNVLRDNTTPEGQGWFMHSYTGPVVYTPEADFQKVDFSTLDNDAAQGRDTAEYQRQSSGGYAGMIQHYFAAAWLAQDHSGANLCAQGGCVMDVKKDGSLYRSGFKTAPVDLPAGKSVSLNARLYAGPQITALLKAAAPHLELTKDYGRVHIFAAPLFWLLNWLHTLVGNWGWAIILLTVIVKALLYPLNERAYKSMAKMRTVAPKMEAIKQKYPKPEDRMAMQQAMMQLYRDEKINPLGGCLPMLLQMPIFIGLYWMIFLSVELRQAPWLGWVHDLSRPDPYWILPALMAATMWFQTTLNPPPSDPMQAQMVKIMPLVFSVMFFFFPSGLVLYYVVNNLLTIAQQWHINRRVGQPAAAPQAEVLDKAPADGKKGR